MNAAAIYAGSDGAATKAYYAELEKCGVMGRIAMNLFRAQKCSARAKVYRRGSFKGMAYERKEWSMGQLVGILEAHRVNGDEPAIPYGWKVDASVLFDGEPSWVLYIDLPELGQVSFHAPRRGLGPDYAGWWDGQHASEPRILALCDRVMAGTAKPMEMFP